MGVGEVCKGGQGAQNKTTNKQIEDCARPWEGVSAPSPRQTEPANANEEEEAGSAKTNVVLIIVDGVTTYIQNRTTVLVLRIASLVKIIGWTGYVFQG